MSAINNLSRSLKDLVIVRTRVNKKSHENKTIVWKATKLELNRNNMTSVVAEQP